ncbi:MAG: small subunit ribosomal protein S4, partial [Natronomonas sp.]
MALGNNTKFYETPNHPFQGERIADEGDLVSRYGLATKEELWRAQSELRDYRREARRLLGEAQGDAEAAAEAGSEFLARLKRIGVLDDEESLDD